MADGLSGADRHLGSADTERELDVPPPDQLGSTADSADELEERVRRGIRHSQGSHHSRCSTRVTAGCDCYAREAAEAHDALDVLVARLRAAEEPSS